MDTLTLARSFASLLLDTAAKGTVLLLLACLAAWLCRRSSAALRHSIWCMTMGGLLVLPVASWALPAWQIPILPPEPLPAPVAEVAKPPTPPVAEVVRLPASPQILAPSGRSNSPVLSPPTMGETASVHPDTAVPERPPVVPSVIEPVPAPVPAIVEPASEPWTTIEWTSLLVSAGWLLGVSLFGVLLLVGLWRTVKLRRTSLTVADGEWPGMLVELRQRLGLSRAVELREHAESVVPLTWGIWRPVVLLPKLARAWDEPMRRAVLLHELAHVQRGDVACQVLGRLTCVLYWFHPLAWFALRQLRQEREQACDDAVVGTGEKASDYAEQLLQVARLCCAPRGLSLGVAMAEGSSLERRVKSLFDSACSHGPLTRRVAIASVLIGGAVLLGLAPIQPTRSDAQPVEVTDKLRPAYEATVDILVEKLVEPGNKTTKVNGAGVILDSNGHIVTAQQVVDGAKTIQVTLHDGSKLSATVVANDAAYDLTLLRVHHTQPLKAMPEQSLDTIKVTDEVMSIGNSFGYPHTVSRGIISALKRDLELRVDQKFSNLIQTDISGNPGGNGGPLLNAEGAAIGVNLHIQYAVQKIGFAVPIQEVRKAFASVLGQPSAQANTVEKPGAVHSTFEKAFHATVDITTDRTPAPSDVLFQTNRPKIDGMGTGIIVDESGFVVTANHVVAGANSIQVSLFDGTTLAASVVAQNQESDLAVLRIHPAQPLTVMPEQHTDPVKVGDEVTAIGNAFGWKHTVSRGIVSSLGRDVELNEERRYKNLIQMDLSLNPGSSGGPLLNAKGEAIGINIAIRAGAQKIGFAIPIQDARKVFVGLMSPIISGLSAKEQMELLKPKFGDAKRGIQLGVAFASPSATNYALGERMPMVLFFRNAGQKEVTFQVHFDFMAYPPSVVNEDGQKQSISSLETFIDKPTRTITLKPDEVYSVETYGLGLGKKQGAPSFESPVDGKYTIEFSEGIFWNLNDPQEKWSEGLTSGTLEFEVTSGLLGQQTVLIPQAASNLDAADAKAPFPTARQAIVSIATEKPAPEVPGVLNPAAIIQGAGAGFIVNARGYVVTAKHVVDGARKIRVKLHDGTELPASVAGADPKTDLAVLLIHTAQPLTVMPEQHQVQAKVGDEVTAIGKAWGHSNTISRGVVTGLNRDVELSETQRYTNLIQTDAANDPGYSGGPLLNAQGEAIGINIAFRAGAQKVAFAMPITEARNAYVNLMSRVISGPAAKEQMELLKPVFGEAKRGIQLGLAVSSLERTFPQGGRIPLWLFYRNLGDKELTFHLSQDFMNHPATVTDANGNRVQVNFVMHWMFIAPLKITLQPGEVWCIATPGLYLGDQMPSIKPVAGKYKLTYPQGIWDVKTTQRLNTDIPLLPSGTPDISGLLNADPNQPVSNNLAGQIVETPNWSESLTTGEIEFEIAPGKNGQLEARVLAAVDVAGDIATPAIPPDINPSQVITGVVVDARDQPVAGATVWCVVDQDKTTRQPITARVETNAQGEFRFTVPQSSLDYGLGHFQQAAWAWKPGHGIGVGNAVASTHMPKNPDARLRLPETSAVTLQVVDEKGQPLAGAEVSPRRVQASQVPGMPQDGPFSMVALPPKELHGIATRKTDAEGRVTLDLVPRRFLSSVLVNSASHGEQSFSYYADVLKLNAVTSLEGELSNHQAGVRLWLRTDQTQPQTERRGPREIISADVQVVTDTRGRFTVPIFPVGEWTIASEELNGPQFLSANSLKGELVAGVANKLTLDVITGIPVKGRVVVRGENKGVANASVYVQTFANLETGHVAQTLCQTDQNGEYSSYTLPGHYVASSLASLGNDATLIHPRLSSYPPSFQQPPQIAADAKEATLPEIAVDRGKQWSGTLVDEQENPIDGAYVMPLQSGKRMAPAFPTFQGGNFSFNLVKGAAPQAWHLIVDHKDPEARTLPLQVLKKDPLVLQVRRDAISKSMSDPNQIQESFNPLEGYTGGFSPEEIEESRIATEGVHEVLKKAGLSDAEITRFNTIGPSDLTGIVLDATTQEPIAGADIKFMMVPRETKTDARGVFRVEGLKLPPEFTQTEFPNGIPVLGTIRKDGYAPRAFCQPLGKAGLVALLDNQTYFEGVITDPAGQPVARATVKSVWETLLGFEGQEVPLPMSSSTTTNADGTYRLPVGSSLPNSGGGNTWRNEGHDLQVIAPGVGSARKTEEYIGPHSQTKLSLQLIPAIHFRAKVIDSLTGAPAPGFVLYTTSAPYIQGRSDSEGNLVIKDLFPGDVHFVAGDGEAIPYENFEWEGPEYVYRNERYGRWWSPDAKPGQGWSGLGLHVPKENQLQGNHDALRFKLIPELPIQTIMVERTATISGRVTDPDGRPVSGAKVTPICDGRTVGEHETTSQEDGRYVLSVLASKNVKYHLMVQDGASQTWANGVSADLATNPAQEIKNFDLQLTRPGRVTGRVVQNGKPVANSPVRTVDCEHREYVYYGPSTKTKDDGTFELNRVRPGKHFLRAGDLRWPLDKDKGTVIEVVAGEVVADQVLEVKQEPNPDEGMVPEPTPAVEGPAAPQKEPMPVGQNEETPKADADVDLDKVVWWGEAVDGLEPGFWLTKSEDPRNLRIPMNSLVNYRVVVRNTMDKEIEFLVRLLPFDDQDVPYLIPSDKLDSKGKITPPQPAKEFQARGAAKELSGLNAVQAITLDAGESVLLPECGLYVGKAPDERYPQIADFVPGTHWIVQPLLVHPLSFKERGEFARLGGKDSLTKIARDGKTRQERVVYATGSWHKELKPAFAKYHLEVGTLNAAAHRNAEKATWGQIEQGMQCGLRILNPQPSYKLGDTLEAEVLWRNTSQAVITTTLPRQLDLYPSIDDSQGQHRSINFGARFELLPPTHDYQPGEVRSLGVVKVTLVAEGTPGPKTNQEPGQITLEPGQYKLKASGGVGNISPWSGSVEFTVTRAPAAVPEETTTDYTITGQVVNDKKEPLVGAEVALVLEEDNDSTQKGRVAVQTTTDDEGRYVLNLPPEVVTSKRFGAVWARAKGHTLARGHWSSVIPALSNRKDQLTLTATTGTRVQVLDQAGKPLEGVRVRVGRVGIPEGVGYEPPTGWEDHLSATTDSHGEATLTAAIPESVRELSLQPPKQEAELQFGRNYFLNVRPRSEGRHFSFRLPETGSVEGQLNVAKGHRLPEGLTLEVRSCSLELPQFDGVVRVPVAADGTFRIEQISTGQLIVPPFLAEEQPLRAVVPPHVEVPAGKTARLEVSVAPGVRVQGRVIRSDLKTGFVKYPVTVIYGQSITNRRVDFDRQKFELTTNDEGVFTCVVPPGPIEVQAATHMDGYQRTSSWLPEGKRGMWGGTRFVVPKRESFELEPIELTKSVPIQGKLIDQNKAVVEGWKVYGYPEVPGFEPSSTMNSFAGVHTMKDGHFEGTYPQSYPPVRWKVSHRVWKTKYEFDDIKYRAEVVQKSPLILQVDTTKPLED